MAKHTRHSMRHSIPTFTARVFTTAARISTLFFVLFATAGTNQIAATEATSLPLAFKPANIDDPLPKGVDAQTGFRMQRYRSPVPQSNPGIETVSTARAFQLYQTGQVKFIDVYPPRGLGADPLDGTWLMSESHENIAGSVWLPEVGRGHLETEHIEYFKRNLHLISGGDKNTFLLFYCTADCWQSWNAARRARLWGYANIFWYPDGTDGWIEEDHTIVPAQPVNFLGQP